MKTNLQFTWVEKDCNVCGKTFILTSEWVYKRNGRLFCSWKCMRKDEKEHEQKKCVVDNRREYILNALQEGKPIKEIADEVGLSERMIFYWRQKFVKEGELDEWETGGKIGSKAN